MPGAAKRFWHIRECFGSAGAAWQASETQLMEMGGFQHALAANIVALRKTFVAKAFMDKLRQERIQYIYHLEPEYPSQLQHIYDPPPGLFVRGSIKVTEQPMVAMVGSRKPTAYGIAVAEHLSAKVAGAGVTVVSGLAKGVDTAVHRGALKGGGTTLAVLGCGVDVVYPKENARLMEQMIKKGAVVSEFPPGAKPLAWHFPLRNRLISGLSQAVVVVEAAARSGALITADMALEQGREVMAVPGNISSPLSCGPNRLLKQGARLVSGPEDILEDLGLQRAVSTAEEKRQALSALSGEEKTVAGLLSLEPISIDTLVERSGLTAQQVLSALMFLELKGFARQLPGKYYVMVDY